MLTRFSVARCCCDSVECGVCFQCFTSLQVVISNFSQGASQQIHWEIFNGTWNFDLPGVDCSTSATDSMPSQADGNSSKTLWIDEIQLTYVNPDVIVRIHSVRSDTAFSTAGSVTYYLHVFSGEPTLHETCNTVLLPVEDLEVTSVKLSNLARPSAGTPESTIGPTFGVNTLTTRADVNCVA